MLGAVYVDAGEEQRVVAIKPKASWNAEGHPVASGNSPIGESNHSHNSLWWLAQRSNVLAHTWPNKLAIARVRI